MNWYYELEPETTVFGQDVGQYVVMHDCSPANGGKMNYQLHDQALQVALRAWVENQNGVSIFEGSGVTRHKRWIEKEIISDDDLKEFMWIKLKARNLK